MSVIRSFTIEKPAIAPAGGIYEIPRDIPNGNMILSAARVDVLLATPNDYSSIPKSVSIQLGTIIGSDFVIDNQVDSNYFKVILELSIVQINGDHYLSSNTTPNTSFRMSGDLAKRFVFVLRDQNNDIIDPDYFSFHFTVISPN